ncbi:MAG: peptide deformylase [Candidatus Nealsonbacteria bacterium]
MKLEIKKFNENILRVKAEEIKEITDETKQIVLDMVEILKEKQGIGLAGPQVGISKRIIIVQPDPRHLKFIALINPKTIKKGKETEMQEEGCLSFPGIFLKIKRAREIEVEAINIEGKKINIKAKGVFARLLQHEIDHLNGTLFFNRLNFLERVNFKLKHLNLRI